VGFAKSAQVFLAVFEKSQKIFALILQGLTIFDP
jgi:hypothetical protein